MHGDTATWGEGEMKEMETTCEGCSKLLNTDDTFVTGNRVDNVGVASRNDKGKIVVAKKLFLFLTSLLLNMQRF